MPLLGRGDSGFESLHPDSMEKFPGEVEILNKELEQKFPNLEAEAYKESLCAFAEKIFTQENFVGFGKTANVYKYPDENTGLCFKYVHNLIPGNHDIDVEAKYMTALKNSNTKVRVPQPFATIFSPMKLKKDKEGNRVLEKDRVLVMEYIDGYTLEELKKSNIELSEDFDAKLFFDELEKFVAEMHEKKIYHRDLHDKNVMVDRAPNMPVVIDFGRANRSYLTDETNQEIYTSYEVENGKEVEKLLPNDNEFFSLMRKEYESYLTK
jgi:serine/threonine protein kinase